MHKIPVGVLGASGYAGRELCELIAAHPTLDLRFAAANQRRGESVSVGRGAAARRVTFCAADDAPLGEAAVVFSALPHGASAPLVVAAHAAGARVVDLSSDLRPGNAPSDATAAEALAGLDAPYGLTEALRERVRGAQVVANPGCYPTAILTALRPLARAGLVPAGASIVVNAASGVSGAGNAPKAELLYGEVAENFRAYGAGNEHRHLPEMRAMLGCWGVDADLVFTPHLLPTFRGILATIVVPVAELPDDPASLWREAYAGEPFVEVADAPPALAEVAHRNVVRLAVRPLAHVRQPALQLFAAIDNLVKGAAGQALQNANLLLGLEETAGLPT